jgi:hypothetical protein
MPFQVYHRIDVKDTMGKWLEAQIVEINHGEYVKIHYKGWAPKFDEYLPVFSEDGAALIDKKYAEIGLYSNAFG